MKNNVLISLSALLLFVAPACHRSGKIPNKGKIAGTDLVLVHTCWEAFRDATGQPFNFKVCIQTDPLPAYKDAVIRVVLLPETPSMNQIEIVDLARDIGHIAGLFQDTIKSKVSGIKPVDIPLKLSEIFGRAQSDLPSDGLELSVWITSNDGRNSKIDGIVIRFATNR